MQKTFSRGKFANQPLSTVPKSYLRWALTTPNLTATLELLIRREINRRNRETMTPAEMDEALTRFILSSKPA